jgi:hypothetical protein
MSIGTPAVQCLFPAATLHSQSQLLQSGFNTQNPANGRFGDLSSTEIEEKRQ